MGVKLKNKAQQVLGYSQVQKHNLNINLNQWPITKSKGDWS